jgi:hypothetical protein
LACKGEKMNANENSKNNGFVTPPVRSTEAGGQYVRPIDILRSERGREQIRLLRQAKLVETSTSQSQNSNQSKS